MTTKRLLAHFLCHLPQRPRQQDSWAHMFSTNDFMPLKGQFSMQLAQQRSPQRAGQQDSRGWVGGPLLGVC
eukprot:1160253-Pelagomonas_calceolata.AAC.4